MQPIKKQNHSIDPRYFYGLFPKYMTSICERVVQQKYGLIVHIHVFIEFNQFKEWTQLKTFMFAKLGLYA